MRSSHLPNWNEPEDEAGCDYGSRWADSQGARGGWAAQQDISGVGHELSHPADL